MESNPNPNGNQTTPNPLKNLTPTNLALASMILGIVTFIFVFFPSIQILTNIIGIIALIVSIYSYYVTNGSLLTVIGLITSSIPLLFFLFLQLFYIYTNQPIDF
ncbi:hypothetical protein [Shimazuella kribbensis]|uniref:hypothetical protein n=1 Tax=Shimazuella kribbensis TaxID=139808 RepID=UPI000401ED0E|nr:hypothetical protein [Shimazuella kribbensis]